MQRLSRRDSQLQAHEYQELARLTTPIKIQDYLNALPMNWEKSGDTYYSPRRVLRERKAHCIEGALVAATALWLHGEPPLIMNLSPRMGKGDYDHVVTLYKRDGLWGAISKTNHSSLRFRDPIYRSPRELAISYFHEWYLPKSGEKLLECYSKPLNLSRLGTEWITAETNLDIVADALSVAPHYYFVPSGSWRYIRPVDPIELKANELIEWPKSDPRT